MLTFKDTDGPAQPRSSTVETLAHSVGRLGEIAGQTVGLSVQLVGPWPVTGAATSGGADRRSDSVFDSIEGLAQTINRICDDLLEANAAVARRL